MQTKNWRWKKKQHREKAHMQYSIGMRTVLRCIVRWRNIICNVYDTRYSRVLGRKDQKRSQMTILNSFFIKRNRRVYKIIAQGGCAFTEMIREWARIRRAVQSLLAISNTIPSCEPLWTVIAGFLHALKIISQQSHDKFSLAIQFMFTIPIVRPHRCHFFSFP